MIKKSLLLRPSTTLFPNSDVFNKAFLSVNLLPRTTERWNQANFGYFNLYLNKAHSESKIVLVRKEVYYRDIVLFVQYLQNLVIFKRIALVKANIAISFCVLALKWYILELSDFDHNVLNNNLGIKSKINTLLHRFKVLTSIALDLLTNKTYLVNNTQARQTSAQYIHTIMQYRICCNIVDIANQLSFVYRKITSKLKVYILLSIETIEASEFIRALEEKQ